MDDVVLLGIVYLVISMGFISILWLRRGVAGITDRVISGLFRSLIAMTAVALVFSIWVFVSTKTGVTYESVTLLLLVAIFALISRAALTAKQIGELYGFKVTDRK